MMTSTLNPSKTCRESDVYLHKSLFPVYHDEFEDDIDQPEMENFDDDDHFAENINYLREFILSSALYVESLENAVCDRSDEYWEAREHAYRIITAMLIDLYQYETEG